MKYVITENIVKKYSKGNVYAISFAKGMTEKEIAASLKNNPPLRKEWRPFNETIGRFI